jgi:hypothetical protein
MPTYSGTVKRVKPRVNVMRGYTGNEPQSLSRSAPVEANTTIKSGQAIALDVNEEWVLATSTDTVVYIAYHDSEDTDVLSCGKLLGFSTLGSYELETAYTTDAGLAFATGAGLSVEVSALVDGSLTLQGVGAGDDAGSVSLGRTSCAAVDLSTGGRGGYTTAGNLGEDDSSLAWGSQGSAAAWTTAITANAGAATDKFTISFKSSQGTHTTGEITFGANIAAASGAIEIAILALEASDSAFDGLIVSAIDDTTDTVDIIAHAGAAGQMAVTVNEVVNGGTLDVSALESQAGTNATATSSKQVLRWVTTAS